MTFPNFLEITAFHKTTAVNEYGDHCAGLVIGIKNEDIIPHKIIVEFTHYDDSHRKIQNRVDGFAILKSGSSSEIIYQFGRESRQQHPDNWYFSAVIAEGQRYEFENYNFDVRKPRLRPVVTLTNYFKCARDVFIREIVGASHPKSQPSKNIGASVDACHR